MMNFSNGIYNARTPSTNSIALLQEGGSGRTDRISFTKRDGKQTLEQRSYETDHSCISKNSSTETGSSRTPWLNTFLQKSARYVDFLATQEACNVSNTSHYITPQTTSAAGAGATQYAQMRRISSRPLLGGNSGVIPFTLEWALDELLAADKWLHEKYVTSPEHKNSVRDQAGDFTENDGNLNNFSTRILERGDSHGVLEAGTSQNVGGLNIVTQDTVNLLNILDENDGHHSNTLPRNVKDLFAVGKKKTPSSCSLPDNSRVEVISRFLAAES